MSDMFDGISTETLRTLHRQVSEKAIAVYMDACTAADKDLDSYNEIMDYGRQLHSTARLISAELAIRHQIVAAAREMGIPTDEYLGFSGE